MRKIIGIILIVAAVGFGMYGFNIFNASTESIEILNVELTASDSDQKNSAFIYFGLALASLIGGIALVSRRS